MIKKLNDNAIQIQSVNGGCFLTLNKTGNKISVNISGPRGGQQRATIVNGDDLLEMLDTIGGISLKSAWHYAEIVQDGACPICGNSINLGERICCDCLNAEIARHRQYCDGYTHQGIR